MQSTLFAVFFAFFASSMVPVMALPTPSSLTTRACNALKCAVALGPTGVGCVAAAAEVGANPIADAGCVAGAVNSVANAPAACSGCGSGIASKVESGIGSVESAISGIF